MNDLHKITCSWRWRLMGEVKLDSTDKLTIPSNVGKQAGIYKFKIESLPLPQIYIGETRNLRERLKSYRASSMRRRTEDVNHRVRQVLTEMLSDDICVKLFIMEKIRFGRIRGYGLDSKLTRLYLEGAAVIEARLSQEGGILNIDL